MNLVEQWQRDGRDVMFNKAKDDLTPSQRVGKWLEEALMNPMKDGVIINADYATDRQVALLAATGKYWGFPGKNDLESVLETAERYLEWLRKD